MPGFLHPVVMNSNAVLHLSIRFTLKQKVKSEKQQSQSLFITMCILLSKSPMMNYMSTPAHQIGPWGCLESFNKILIWFGASDSNL
jgi:hypothetical protein